jgi:hypothetical protein
MVPVPQRVVRVVREEVLLAARVLGERRLVFRECVKRYTSTEFLSVSRPTTASPPHLTDSDPCVMSYRDVLKSP